MKRVVKISADGVDLTVTIEGTAPLSLIRSIGKQAQYVAFDQAEDAVVSTEVYGEDVAQ